MTHDELKSAIERIAGGPGHGMVKAAARRLDVSTKTVQNALNSGVAATKFRRKIADELLKLERHEPGLSIYGKAGTWSVGHVETRQRGRVAVDEAVVTHLCAPIFILHMQMIRGKGTDGEAIWEEAVHWCDEPSSDAVRADLLSVAREKAKNVVYERSQATATARVREHHERQALATGLSQEEIDAIPYRELATEATGVIVTERLAELSSLIDERMKDWSALPRATRDAVRAGPRSTAASLPEEIGALKMLYRIAEIAMIDAPQSPIPAYIAAKAYDLLPLADKRTKRGKIEHATTPPAPAPEQAQEEKKVTDYSVFFDDLPDNEEDTELASRKRVAEAVRAALRQELGAGDLYAELGHDEREAYAERLSAEIGMNKTG